MKNLFLLILFVTSTAFGALTKVPYSGLNLTGSIVSSDISASAAIPYSKLNLADGITNADVSGTAAIDWSKMLDLTASRVPVTNVSGDISASSVTSTELGYLSGVTSSLCGNDQSCVQTNKTLSAPTFTGTADTTAAAFAQPTILGGTVSGSTIYANDDNFIVRDNLDLTKRFAFDASGITAGQTRVLTVPDSNMTLAATNVAQTYTAIPNLNAGLTASGTITVSSPITLNGGQVVFPATQNPSSNANTLDDYEEGTWTPTMTSATGSITSYTSSGRYQKIGNRVYYSVVAVITNAGTGAGLRASLPFASASVAGYMVSGREDSATGNALVGVVSSGSSYVSIYLYNNTNACVTNYQILVSGFYEVSN